MCILACASPSPSRGRSCFTTLVSHRPNILIATTISDALLTLCLFAAILGLYERVFTPRSWKGKPLAWGTLLLLGIALFSYAAVQQAPTKLFTRFVVELSEHIFDALFVLVIGLWLGTLFKRMRASAAVNLVWVMMIYFALAAAAFIPRMYIYPQQGASLLVQIAGLWLVVGAGFAAGTDDSRYA